MQVTQLSIPGVLLIVPRRYEDARGYFSELYNYDRFRDIGIPDVFVQDNFSLSASRGTVRGLHFQRFPHEQAKLVRVSRGRIHDVVVDLRPSSPKYKAHISIELYAENGWQLYVPAGLAHGFCTLEPNTEVIYKVSAGYSPQSEGGILWSDPDLEIAWPVAPGEVTISEKDRGLPMLKDLGQIF